MLIRIGARAGKIASEVRRVVCQFRALKAFDASTNHVPSESS